MKKHIIFFLLCFPLVVFSNISDSLKTSKIQIGISITPDYSFRKIKSDDASNFISVIKDSLEVPRYSYSAGIDVCYSFSKYFSFQTGVLFSDKGYKTKSYSLNNNPLREEPIKNSFTYHYYYLDIPLRINAQHQLKKLTLMASAGISANIFITQQTTSYLEYNYKDAEKVKQIKREDLSALNLAMIASIGICYKIKPSLSFVAEPTYKRSLTSIANTPIKTYLYSTGLTIGLLFQL